ncbi:hypothetical protein BD769DRAFT_1628067 [Suillus cothurnatus]|nr:hypothetical protein BD769DRAFT_1628067 [Suillus cothurnatus]
MVWPGPHPKSITAMQPGACAVLCPACPCPGKKGFLYTLFVAIDVNFQLTQCNILSDTVDPGLNHETEFKSSLNSCGCIIQEASHGLAATGAGTFDCIRHNFKWPNSVGDLQKGERYINMDYMFFYSMLLASTLQVINISYDITSFPQQYYLDDNSKTINFCVPKFHLPAHILSCQTAYSFNFIKGVGRTDSKAPEHGCVNINPVTTST